MVWTADNETTSALRRDGLIERRDDGDLLPLRQQHRLRAQELIPERGQVPVRIHHALQPVEPGPGTAECCRRKALRSALRGLSRGLSELSGQRPPVSVFRVPPVVPAAHLAEERRAA